MVRKKKSLLFSVSLASVGLVAGALIVAAPKSQATDTDELSNDELTSEISEVADVHIKDVKESLSTHKLIADIKDPSALENYEDIVDYKKLTDRVYILKFSSYEATAKNYLLMKEDEAFNNVVIDRIIKSDNKVEALTVDDTFWDSHMDCAKVALGYTSPTTYVGATKVPIECKAWGVSTMKQDTFTQSHASSSNQIKVAVIDSGIRATHQAFKNSSAKDRLLTSMSYDYIDSDTDPNDDTLVGHGTAVASVIAESTPASVKVASVRVMGSASMSGSTVTTNLLSAVADYSTGSKHANVINLSLGLTGTNQNNEKVPISSSEAAIYDQVFQAAQQANTIVVAAAGNDGKSWLHYPASSPYVIGVSSVGPSGTFSSAFSNYSSDVDFAAPGEELILADVSSDSEYVATDGTSFSSPFTAAMVANILTEHPNYTFSQVYNELKLNAEDLGTSGRDNKYGWGSLSFHVHKYADLNIATPTLTPAAGTWTNGSVTLKANATSSNYNISNYNTASSNTSGTTPTLWSSVSSPAKTYTISQNASANGTYTFWAKNSNRETATKTVTVSNIDKTDPTISTALSTSNINATGATLNIGVTDTASGLNKIVWHYKESSASSYTDKTDTYTTSGTGATSATTKTTALSGLASSKSYTAYATVYDMAGNHKDSATVNFTTGSPSATVPATAVTVSPATATITVGGNTTLSASITPSNSTDTITWSSSDTTIATVNNSGKVTAVKAGTVTITARANANVAGTATITVQAQTPTTVPATAVTVSPMSVSLNVSETATITASMTPSNTTDSITWSSSDTTVVTVNNAGKITAVKAGTATITARANANVAGTVTVTVQEQTAPTNPTDPTTPSEPSNPSNKPKPVKTTNDVKNPKTADANVGAIAGVGAILSLAAYFVFRAKRR